jgi:Rha family phage regulatory protein
MLTVSSRQVAEDFEKDHKNIIRDIEELKRGWLKIEQPPQELHNIESLFIESTYVHPQNKQTYKCYELTRDGFSLLVMGFTGKKALEWKLKYIEAFNLMEKKLKEGFTSNHIDVQPMDYLQMVMAIANDLHMNDASKVTTYKKVLKCYDLPTNTLPEYVPSKGILHSATELLKRNNCELSAVAFNKLLLANGYLTEHSRPSKSTASGIKVYKSLTEKGLEFGENQVNPNNARETQPLYYDEKFTQLYDLVIGKVA